MNCQRFEAELDELVDQRLPASSDVSLMSHAERCPRCARLLADYEAVVEAMNQVRLPDASEMGARILAELTAPADSPAQTVELTKNNPRHALIRGIAWTAATVAAVLLVAAIAIQRSISPNPEESHPIVAKSPAHSPNDRIILISMEFHNVADLIDAQHRNLEQVSDRLRPVTRSMSAAFRALQHSQPRSDSSARSS